MTNDRVSAWLVDLGLGIYRETFKQNAIDWDVLPDLSDGDLEALGVLLGHRKKLLRAIASLPQSVARRGRNFECAEQRRLRRADSASVGGSAVVRYFECSTTGSRVRYRCAPCPRSPRGKPTAASNPWEDRNL